MKFLFVLILILQTGCELLGKLSELLSNILGLVVGKSSICLYHLSYT